MATAVNRLSTGSGDQPNLNPPSLLLVLLLAYVSFRPLYGTSSASPAGAPTLRPLVLFQRLFPLLSALGPLAFDDVERVRERTTPSRRDFRSSPPSRSVRAATIVRGIIARFTAARDPGRSSEISSVIPRCTPIASARIIETNDPSTSLRAITISRGLLRDRDAESCG